MGFLNTFHLTSRSQRNTYFSKRYKHEETRVILAMHGWMTIAIDEPALTRQESPPTEEMELRRTTTMPPR